MANPVLELFREVTFNGATYQAEFDADRLGKQMKAIYMLMCDGQWRTLGEIRTVTDYPLDSSISARLRDLRKKEFGGFLVERRRRGESSKGLFEYRVLSKPEGYVSEYESIEEDALMAETNESLEKMLSQMQKTMNDMLALCIEINKRTASVSNGQENNAHTTLTTGSYYSKPDHSIVQSSKTSSPKEFNDDDQDVFKDPAGWSGPSMVGKKYSECSAEYLDATAEMLEAWARNAEREGKTNKNGKPLAPWHRKNASVAKRWAERNRNIAPTDVDPEWSPPQIHYGKEPQVAATNQPVSEDEIPF